MENRMRDLDQLEEQDPEERRRRIGTVLMAVAATVGLTLAIGVVIGKAAEPRDLHEHDPLDQLDRVANPATAADELAPVPAPKALRPVDTTKLTFERELTEHEERPEVIAALEAAAREEETLASAGSPTQPAAPQRAAAETTPVVESQPLGARHDRDDGDDADDGYAQQLDQLREERVQKAMPAGMAASSASHKLAKAARHDKLVADALPKQSSQPRARVGEEGEFTLQVISYDTLSAAQAFANGLRGKGHEAFVVTGEVDGRGRYYRVRIGPFKTKPQAEAYRHTFEAQERMNTIVVKRVQSE
jgi:cell division septation protein DedD